MCVCVCSGCSPEEWCGVSDQYNTSPFLDPNTISIISVWLYLFIFKWLFTFNVKPRHLNCDFYSHEFPLLVYCALLGAPRYRTSSVYRYGRVHAVHSRYSCRETCTYSEPGYARLSVDFSGSRHESCTCSLSKQTEHFSHTRTARFKWIQNVIRKTVQSRYRVGPTRPCSRQTPHHAHVLSTLASVQDQTLPVDMSECLTRRFPTFFPQSRHPLKNVKILAPYTNTNAGQH